MRFELCDAMLSVLHPVGEGRLRSGIWNSEFMFRDSTAIGLTLVLLASESLAIPAANLETCGSPFTILCH